MYYIVREVRSNTFTASPNGKAEGERTFGFGTNGRPHVNAVISLSDDNSTNEYTIMSSLTPKGPEYRYLHFRKAPDPEDPNAIPPTGQDQVPLSSQSKFAFKDIPEGTKTMEAPNGSLVMAGSHMTGMAMSSSNKFLLKSDNTQERITPHSVELLGQCVKVSSFVSGFTIEIDLIQANNTSPITTIINSIHTEVSGGRQYQEVYDEIVGPMTGPEKQLIELFGIHIAELVTLHDWSRVKMSGNIYSLMNEYLTHSIYDFSQLVYYANGSPSAITSLEVYLSPATTFEFNSVQGLGGCQDIVPLIIGVEVTINSVNMSVSTMSMHLSDGQYITYADKQTSYAIENSIVAKNLFTSGLVHKSSAQQFHRDHTEELISEITIGVSGVSLCGQVVNFTQLSFAADANISIGGELNLTTGGTVSLLSPSSVSITGAGRGLIIDSTGVSTTA